MSTHHAAAGEVVNLATWANDLPSEKSKSIVKTDGVELARLVIKADEDSLSGFLVDDRDIRNTAILR